MNITYIVLMGVLVCFAAITAMFVINRRGDAGYGGPGTAKQASSIRSKHTLKPEKPFTRKPSNVSDVKTPWGW